MILFFLRYVPRVQAFTVSIGLMWILGGFGWKRSIPMR